MSTINVTPVTKKCFEIQWILDIVNLEKSSLYQISSLYREVSRFREDFQPFFTKIHDIGKIQNFTQSSNHCIVFLLANKKFCFKKTCQSEGSIIARKFTKLSVDPCTKSNNLPMIGIWPRVVAAMTTRRLRN